MNASFVNELTAACSSRYGRVVFGDAMYQHWIELDKSGKVTSSQLARSAAVEQVRRPRDVDLQRRCHPTPGRTSTRCGRTAYGHADGVETSITGHGKVPGTFGDPNYFRFTPPVKSDWLFGEQAKRRG